METERFAVKWFVIVDWIANWRKLRIPSHKQWLNTNKLMLIFYGFCKHFLEYTWNSSSPPGLGWEDLWDVILERCYTNTLNAWMSEWMIHWQCCWRQSLKMLYVRIPNQITLIRDWVKDHSTKQWRTVSFNSQNSLRARAMKRVEKRIPSTVNLVSNVSYFMHSFVALITPVISENQVKTYESGTQNKCAQQLVQGR